jgi:hypothetical protein
MLGQKIRANISLLHIVHRSELSVVFIIARVAVGGRELGEHCPTSGDSTCVVLYSPQALTLMMSPSRFHIVFYEVAWEGADPVIILRGWATGTRQYRCRISISIRSINLQDYYTIPHQLPRQKQAAPGPTMSLVRWDISFQERQERVSPWSSQEIRDQRRRWWRKEWRPVPSCRVGRVPKRSW